jgi:hypothetical protein
MDLLLSPLEKIAPALTPALRHLYDRDLQRRAEI